ncbi:hypothetical protein AB3X96_43000, partial [Paraburkholderia sp. BR13439]|uniref:hypothetical protein n=1 Tax=unclassified Paraburkholderia TaxID=2615204 RepID=UPI0034CECF3A
IARRSGRLVAMDIPADLDALSTEQIRELNVKLMAEIAEKEREALGRSNWLFAGSLRAGKRAAAIMTLIRSAQLNGHDPLAYLKD